MNAGLYVDQLPGVLAADDFAVRFTRIFEDIGTPLYDRATAFPALFDRHLAPPEVARWLGGWLAIAVDETLDAARRRNVVTAAADHFGTRGTAPALAALLGAVTGGPVTIEDPGEIRRLADVPPAEAPVARVLIHMETLGGLARSRIESLVRDEVPAWVPFAITTEEDPAPVLVAAAPHGGEDA